MYKKTTCDNLILSPLFICVSSPVGREAVLQSCNPSLNGRPLRAGWPQSVRVSQPHSEYPSALYFKCEKACGWHELPVINRVRTCVLIAAPRGIGRLKPEGAPRRITGGRADEVLNCSVCQSPAVDLCDSRSTVQAGLWTQLFRVDL